MKTAGSALDNNLGIQCLSVVSATMMPARTEIAMNAAPNLRRVEVLMMLRRLSSWILRRNSCIPRMMIPRLNYHFDPVQPHAWPHSRLVIEAANPTMAQVACPFTRRRTPGENSPRSGCARPVRVDRPESRSGHPSPCRRYRRLSAWPWPVAPFPADRCRQSPGPP